MGDFSRIMLNGTTHLVKDALARLIIQQEIAERTNSDTVINARIDEIISPSGSAPSAAEVTDARIGANGVTYGTLGTAVRTQIDNTNQKINEVGSKIATGKQLFNKDEIVVGYYYDYRNGNKYENASWCYYKIPISGNTTFTVNRAANIAYFNVADAFISGDLNSANAYSTYTTPTNTSYMIFSCTTGNANAALVELGSQSTMYEGYYNYFKYESPYKPVTLHTMVITTSTYESQLPSFNDAHVNTSYVIEIPERTIYTHFPTDTPYGSGIWQSRQLCLLTTYQTGTRRIQIFVDGSTVYSRSLTGSGGWTTWKNKKEIVVDINGNGDFTSLTEAFAFLKFQYDYTCYVNPGTYDLVAEFEAYYGSDFFTNFNSSTKEIGLFIANRNRVIFSPQSLVTFNYTGSNTDVNTYFSPINTGTYGGELDGLNLVASNCRYGVHDERTTHEDLYYNVYRNCNIYLDNRNNAVFRSMRCIGAGLGINGKILIDGCRFKAERPTGVTTKGIVWYHNTTANTGKSDIHVKNCYFDDDGTVEVTAIGGSSEITECYVSSCHLGSAPIHSIETGYTIDNMALYSFCNEIG